MEHKITLRDFEDKYMPQFIKWLNTPHVTEWYGELSDWINEVQNRKSEYSWLHHFVAEHDGVPFGFCQYYEYIKGGETWHGNLDTGGVYSIDYLIGETEYLGKGFGHSMLKALIEKIRLIEDAKTVIVQPEQENKASRGVLLSCGFQYNSDDGIFYFNLRKNKRLKHIL